MFTAENRDKAQQLLDRYPVARSALLPLLHLVQHQDGFITDEGIAECASLLGLTKAEVNAVATFYSMYKREALGKHLVSVCTNFSCKVRGAQEVYDRIAERLGVGHNETTQDGAITLEHAECLGNCDGAPVVSVDYFNYECLSPEAALELVERVAAGEVPPPTRGYPSPGIREVSHQLAGMGPFNAALPGLIPDQAQGDVAAPPAPAAGPGTAGVVATDAAAPAGGGAQTTTDGHRAPEGDGAQAAPAGQGADEPVEGLGETSGSGGHDYGPASERSGEPGEPAPDTPQQGPNAAPEAGER